MKNVQEFNQEEVKEIIDYFGQEMKEQYVSVFNSVSHGVLRELHFVSKMLKANKYGYVYFLYNEDTKLTKIGYSLDLTKRFSQIKQLYQNYVGLNPNLKLVGVVYLSDFLLSKFEASVHEFYKDNRKYGEWFDLDTDNIIKDWFLEGEYLFINNTYVLIEDAYEFEYFEEVDKDYVFSESEILSFMKSKYGIKLKDNFDVFNFHKNSPKNNKLCQIYNTHEETGSGLACVCLSIDNNSNNFKCKEYTFGKDDSKYYSIKSLKEEKFKYKDIEKAVNFLSK